MLVILLRISTVVSLLIISAFLFAGPASAQQTEPAIEVYALTGSYYHGNESGTAKWAPQYGIGLLAPLGSKWAALLDVTTSETEESLAFPVLGPRGWIKERRYVFTPSLIRIWRWERLSFYAGGGVGVEHRRERSRLRTSLGLDENQQPVLGDYQDSHFNESKPALLVRGGAIVNLTNRIVLRGDFSFLPHDADGRPSKSAAIGIGYRF